MLRREFLQKTAAAVAASGIPIHADQLAGMRKRVGLIGTGWYGKSDLLRLVQVAPVEVVSLCDVDKRMLAEAARARRDPPGRRRRRRASTATTARCSNSAISTSC